MQRYYIWLLSAVAIACATTSQPGEPPPPREPSKVSPPGESNKVTPEETRTSPIAPAANGLEESFYFVHCFDDRAWILLDGDAHLALEEAAFQSPGADVTMMGGSEDGFVIAETLSPEVAVLAGKALEASAQFRVYNGSDAVTVAKAGAPMLIGRVVPHFGIVQEWSEQGIEPEGESGLLARQDLRNTAAMHLMAPLEVPCHGHNLYWARPEALPLPPVQTFREVGAEAEEEWAAKAQRLPHWADVEARVNAAYEEQGENLPPPDLQVFECAAPLPLPPFEKGCFHVQLHMGTTMCGMGPDEALFSVLWPVDQEVPGLIEERHSPLEPLLIGDFDGDGRSEIVARTDSLSRTVELLRIEGAGLVSVKSTSITYADCPC
jgi:hypothetical protein